ncbi:MAG: hypothetical protein ACFFB5_20580 [Promethearchaeota archaeon]
MRLIAKLTLAERRIMSSLLSYKIMKPIKTTHSTVITFAWFDSDTVEISLFGISVDELDQTKVNDEAKLLKKFSIKTGST